MATYVDADLSFELDREGLEPVRGRLTGSHNRLVLEVDDPGAFAGPQDAPVVRSVAAVLASRGMTVEVRHDGLHLITLGRVKVSWWQRRATGSRHIRLGSLRGAWTAARSRARGTEPLLPPASLLPPLTLWPIAPTFARRDRRPKTTTHGGGGGPRLVLEKEHLWAGERMPVYWLADDRESTIGSGPGCDVRLPGLADLHAVVRHDEEDDEYVVEGRDGATRVHGAAVAGRAVLRTGARVEVGEHVLAFFREEFADHGRPHGGRLGGEAGTQLPQEPRPGKARDL